MVEATTTSTEAREHGRSHEEPTDKAEVLELGGQLLKNKNDAAKALQLMKILDCK